jgi:hypothetical protein
MAGNKRQCHVAFDERPRVSGGYAQSINRADSMPHEDAIKSYHETGGNAATASLPFCNRPVRECSVTAWYWRLIHIYFLTAYAIASPSPLAGSGSKLQAIAVHF